MKTFLALSLLLSCTVFGDCKHYSSGATETRALTLGQKTVVNGQILGCSDGNHGFATYIEVGSCLSTPLISSQNELQRRVLVTCEAR